MHTAMKNSVTTLKMTAETTKIKSEQNFKLNCFLFFMHAFKISAVCVWQELWF